MLNRDQWEDVDGNPIDFTDFLETFSNDLDSDSIAVLEEQTATVSLGIEFAADKSALVILSPSDIELALCSGCAEPPQATSASGLITTTKTDSGLTTTQPPSPSGTCPNDIDEDGSWVYVDENNCVT